MFVIYAKTKTKNKTSLSGQNKKLKEKQLSTN